MRGVANDPRTIRIGLLGCGNVGAALVGLVARQAPSIEARTGLRLEITRIAVRNLSRDRGIPLPEGILTRDAMNVVEDPDVDLIVELIGGIEPARELITAALQAGKPVVTGNKELLANVGHDLFAIADSKGVDLLFETHIRRCEAASGRVASWNSGAAIASAKAL